MAWALPPDEEATLCGMASVALNHSPALVDHLIIDHPFVESVLFFQLLHGSPLLSLH